MKFKPIQPKKISDQVFEQIRELIFRGELKPSEQLMPERELAETLNVSRTTIRNAINKLVVIGLLEHKQGQGTFVTSPETRSGNPIVAAMGVHDATIIDLLEVRMGLECNSAALAARRATQKDYDFLEKSIEEMKDEIKSGRLGTGADASFHMAIAYATKNPVQVYMMKNFYDFLFTGIKKNLKHLYQEPSNLEVILKQHYKILDVIKSKDEVKAYQVMYKHISFVLDYFKSDEASHQPIVPGR